MRERERERAQKDIGTKKSSAQSFNKKEFIKEKSRGVKIY
jgi:hypothetical protein